jgi:FtsH ternary system domain X1
MSAIETAQSVIEWAMARPSSGTPPAGDLRLIEELASPPGNVCALLGELTALTAARLRFSNPPLGDHGPLGTGALLIAAAIGTPKIADLAQLLVRVVPEANSPVEWVARHGLLEPALPFLAERVAEDCRIVSPLTSLLDRPEPSQRAVCLELASRLIPHPAEQLALTLHFAKPTSDIVVRDWRQLVLERLRLVDDVRRDFVLDVYEAMMIHHEQEALVQVRAARTVITNPQIASDDEKLRDAVSVANWWKPLWMIERADVNLLRARHYLGYSYREGLALFRLCQKLVGDVSVQTGAS